LFGTEKIDSLFENKKEIEENNTKYLPMSFNKILDYFNEKGRRRECREVIENSIVSK